MSYNRKAHETVPGTWGALPKFITIIIVYHTIIMKHLDLKMVNKGQHGKVLVAKPDDLSQIPSIHVMERDTNFHWSSGSYDTYVHT